MLIPTRIYVKELVPVIKSGKIKAFAHITGGGLIENIPRILSNNLGVQLDARNWNIPEVFPWLAATGEVNEFEMLRTFNCGIGGVLIVQKKEVSEVLTHLKSYGAKQIGTVININTSNGNNILISRGHNFAHNNNEILIMSITIALIDYV